MDIIEAVRTRKSIRAFKPDPLPQESLKEIMELALRAPSWANTQPWEFAIAGGSTLEKIKQDFLKKAAAGERMNPELAGPGEFPEPYGSRRRTLGIKLFELKGIKREDTEKRRLWGLAGLNLFGAPNAIYIYIDRSFYFQDNSLNAWSVFDCGLVAENIMLLALKYGFGTIVQIQAVAYPDVLRKVLEIPDSKLIVIGIAIGYPDWKDPVNELFSDRDSVHSVVRWHGFD